MRAHTVLVVCIVALWAGAMVVVSEQYDDCDACLQMFQYWSDNPDQTPVSEVTRNFCTVALPMMFQNATAHDFSVCDDVFAWVTTDVETRGRMNKYLMKGCGEFPCPPEKACELLENKRGNKYCR